MKLAIIQTSSIGTTDINGHPFFMYTPGSTILLAIIPLIGDLILVESRLIKSVSSLAFIDSFLAKNLYFSASIFFKLILSFFIFCSITWLEIFSASISALY